jgi:hypothetical protein
MAILKKVDEADKVEGEVLPMDAGSIIDFGDTRNLIGQQPCR